MITSIWAMAWFIAASVLGLAEMGGLWYIIPLILSLICMIIAYRDEEKMKARIEELERKMREEKIYGTKNL